MRGPTAPSSASARRQREHRRLVDDEHVRPLDRVLGPAREALTGDPFEQPVDRRRRRARRLGQAPCRLAGRRAQTHRPRVGPHQVDEGPHRRRLPGARPAGEDRQPRRRARRRRRPTARRMGRTRRSSAARSGAAASSGAAVASSWARRASRRSRRSIAGSMTTRRPRRAARGRPCSSIRAAVGAPSSVRCAAPARRTAEAVPVALGVRRAWSTPASMPRGRVGRQAERARQRVGRREADPVDLAWRRTGPRAARRSRSGPSACSTARGRGGGHAVRVEEQPHARGARACAPRTRGRGADARRPDARDLARAARAGRASTTSSTPAPWRSSRNTAPDGPTCLTDAEHGQQRRVGDAARRTPHALDRELPAVLGVLAPRPADLERLALVHVGERAGQRDLLAVVGRPRRARRSRRPATQRTRDDLGPRAGVGSPGRTDASRDSGAAGGRPTRDRCDPATHQARALARHDPHRDHHALRRRSDDVDEEAFVALLHHLAEHGSRRLRRLRQHRRGGDADRRGAPARGRARRPGDARRASRSSPAPAPTTRATPSS